MFILQSYPVAVLFCIVTMLGWGSWANTLKLTSKEWQFPLYYWDYCIGLVLTAGLFGLTLGSTGDHGRGFIADLQQADFSALGSAFLGGVVFNISNLLIVAATAIAGMSVAFPIAVGLALVIGVVVNYLAIPVGNPFMLFIGVGLIVIAIIFDALAYRKIPNQSAKDIRKGILLSLLSGVLMGFFYRFVAASMVTDVIQPNPGLITSYSAMFIFTIGILLSSFLFNTWFMYRPISGTKVTYTDYLKIGTPRLHLVGLLGGTIWCVAMEFNLIASNQAGFAISYGLGQGATMIAAIWGVFIWKEFKGAKSGVNQLLSVMFLAFIAGLILIVLSKFY